MSLIPPLYRIVKRQSTGAYTDPSFTVEKRHWLFWYRCWDCASDRRSWSASFHTLDGAKAAVSSMLAVQEGKRAYWASAEVIQFNEGDCP